MSKIEWLILLLSIIGFICFTFIPLNLDSNISALIFCLIVLIPTLYVSRNNLNIFFKKIKGKDILLILICVILYYVYVMIIGSLLTHIGIPIESNDIAQQNMDLIFWITLFFQLLGEEIFKVILLILTIFVVYHFINNRKVAVICGIILSLLTFGLMHYNSYNGAIVQIILINGLGSFIFTFAYLKTKNITVSYIAHLLIDAIPIFAMMLFKTSGVNPIQAINFILMLL